MAAAVVVSGADDGGDEIAELFVQLRPGCDLRALQAWIEAHLDRAVRPRRVRLVDSWPLTPNGKVDRAALRATPREGAIA